MTKEELEEQKFILETLPSGRINIRHKKQFVLNGIRSSSAGRGEWLRTLEVKSIEEALAYIKEIEFADFV